MNSSEKKAEENPPQTENPNLKSVTKSVLAAMIGIQSDKNRERDFKKGQAADFIVVGVIFVVALVVGMAVLVNQILPN